MDNLDRGSPEVPAGILHRGETGTGTVPDIAPRPITDLDALPLPDYDDYFRAASRHPGLAARSCLPLEASRGCWWGAKMHCTFCGLNGETMAFRRKGWQRVAEEVEELEARYRPRLLEFTDNILGMDYFGDLLPHWAAGGGGTPKFFEIKANLNRSQVRLLREAGILYVQPGIESFSDRTLKTMGKGVSALQNVAVLRWCQEAGVDAQWNLLFGFPGEDPEEYPAQAALLGRLVHLRAPEACGLIRLDRFSPNFTRFREQGFASIRPMPAYRHVFPLDDAGLAEIAYFFDYEHAHRDRVPELGAPLARLGREWHGRWKRGENGTLAVRPHVAGGHVLVDSRFNREASATRLGEAETALLIAADAPIARGRLLARAAATVAGNAGIAGNGDLAGALARLEALDVVLADGDRLVTLALLPPDLAAGGLARSHT
jgi:ribosomal peptide maturation radical SAM protein 1